MSLSKVPVKIQTRSVELRPSTLELMKESAPKLDRFGNGLTAIEIEVIHHTNPSRHDHSWRVEIAAVNPKHTIRSTGSAESPERAFQVAAQTMEANLRRAARRMHWSRHGRKATLKLREVVEA